MQNPWKHLSGALAAMLIGSLLTGVVMTAPGFLRYDAGAQDLPAVAADATQPNGAKQGDEFGARRPLGGQDLGAAEGLSSAFRNVADFVRPSVVSINTTQTQIIRGRRVPPGFEEFFGVPDEGPLRRESSGTGSGVIVRADGYILTNNHVVEGADELEVEFSDGSTTAGKIIGTDPQTDLAVVKVEQENLKAIPLGNSDAIQVGDWVVAIGSPFGLDQTVTAGIISARGRSLNLLQQDLQGQRTPDGDLLSGFAIEDFLQTDAVINPGNSGGPMVDMSGRVIGINSAIASRTGFYQGYGFAIPINLARRVMEDLIEFGQVRRPQIGVNIREVAPEDSEYYDLPAVEGAFVSEVTDGGPAAQAGIQEEDVIVAINGEPVGYVSQLQGEVAMYRPGERVTVTVYRNGQPRDVTVRLGEAPINTQQAPAPEPEADVVDRIGIGVQELSQDVADQLEYATAGGVVISEVQRGSAADRRGILSGMKLLEINQTTIEEVADVGRVLDAVDPGAVVRFRIGLPDGRSQVITVRMPNE